MWLRSNYSSTCENADALPNVCGLVWYDYNGKKKPNTVGKDVFVYFLMRDKLIPYIIMVPIIIVQVCLGIVQKLLSKIKIGTI